MNKAQITPNEIMEEALGYLNTEIVKDPKPAKPGIIRKAFLCGYVAALHVHRILSEEIFMYESGDFDKLRDKITLFYRNSKAASEKSTTTILYRAHNLRYLKNDHDDFTENDVEGAVLAGYQVALIHYDRYDEIMFTEEPHLSPLVIGELLSFENRCENNARASARIIIDKYGTTPNGETAETEIKKLRKQANAIMDKYGLSASEFKDLFFNNKSNSKRLDESGKLVDDMKPATEQALREVKETHS